MYLLRLLVAEEHTPAVVVTAYRTSKVEKYWSAECKSADTALRNTIPGFP